MKMIKFLYFIILVTFISGCVPKNQQIDLPKNIDIEMSEKKENWVPINNNQLIEKNKKVVK